MPTFDAPEPITAQVRLAAGEVDVDATTTPQTEVRVHPSDPGNPRDVAYAQDTTVEYANGILIVEAPDNRAGLSGSIDVQIVLPEHSNLEVKAGSADLAGSGALGDVEALTGSGDVRLADTNRLTVKAGSGNTRVHRVGRDAEVYAGSGDIDIDHVAGKAWLSTASGDCTVNVAEAAMEVNTASGDIGLGRAHHNVDAKSASGDITIRAAESGVVTFDCASGNVSVGIQHGSAALLDVTSMTGNVYSALEPADQPTESENRVEIRGRTLTGDISITRSS